MPTLEFRASNTNVRGHNRKLTIHPMATIWKFEANNKNPSR